MHGQVVGDLAQFMVQNELTEQELVDRAESLDFPSRCFLDCELYKLPSLHPSAALHCLQSCIQLYRYLDAGHNRLLTTADLSPSM